MAKSLLSQICNNNNEGNLSSFLADCDWQSLFPCFVSFCYWYNCVLFTLWGIGLVCSGRSLGSSSEKNKESGIRGLFHQRLMSSNIRSYEFVFFLSTHANGPIRSQSCIYHYGYTVGVWTKCWFGRWICGGMLVWLRSWCLKLLKWTRGTSGTKWGHVELAALYTMI